MSRPDKESEPHRSDPPVDPEEVDVEQLEPNTGDKEIDTLTPPPIEYTGTTSITDPRAIDPTESMFEQMGAIQDQFDPTAHKSAVERAEDEERQIQMSRVATGGFTSKLTPKPLTPKQLEDEVSDNHNIANITVWVRPEVEYMQHTAVGEYRTHVTGNIVRFALDLNADNKNLLEFELIPDYSPTGFSWYVTADDTPLSKDGSLDQDQARRLDAIKDCSREQLDDILTLEEKVRSASLLLEKPLVGAETRCVPAGWINANCDIDAEVTEPFQPRYKGTFVHSETEIVVEFRGNPPTTEEQEATNKAVDHINQRMMPDAAPPPTQSVNMPDVEREDTHNYEIHFADDSVVETIKTEFGDNVTGRELLHMMRKIPELAQ